MTKYCSKCGLTYEEDIKFCFECGTLLQDSPKPKEAPIEGKVPVRPPSEASLSSRESLVQKHAKVDVPTNEAFAKIWEILAEQEKTREIMGSRLEDYGKIIDYLARRIIIVEEEIKKILEEIQGLREKLESSKR